MRNETLLKKDFYLNQNDKEVLKTAQKHGIRHILEQKESVIPYKTGDELYIFLSFKKKGDEGYSYIRIKNMPVNLPEALALIASYKQQMNLSNIELHTPITNTN